LCLRLVQAPFSTALPTVPPRSRSKAGEVKVTDTKDLIGLLRHMAARSAQEPADE
jgi:hypothetical protein